MSMFVLQGTTYILPLISFPYLVRVLGPSNFGLMAFSQAFIAYFSILVDYGFDLSATRRVALLRNETLELSHFVSAVMTVKVLLAMAAFVLLALVVSLVPRFAADRAIFLFSFLTVLGSVVFPAWLYRGLEAMKMLSALTIFGRALSLLGIFVFVHNPGDLLAAVILQSSALLLSGTLALIFVPKLVPIKYVRPLAAELRHTFADGWHAFLSTSAISVYTSSNVFILGLMTTPLIVGYYAAAGKLITAVTGLASPVSQAVYPHIVGLIAKSRVQALEFIYRLLIAQGGVMLVLSVVLFIAAPNAVRLLLGPQFEACIPLVHIMAALPFLIGLSNVLGIQTMMAFDMKKAFSRIIVGCGVLNIAILFPLIAVAGAAGAASALLIVESVVTVSMVLVLAKRGIMGQMFSSRLHSLEFI
jgi:PST family polysaccharide transporter